MVKVFARQLRLVTLITVGWGLQAQAQPTDFSLPPLPNMATTNSSGLTGSMAPLPSSPIAPNAGAKKTVSSPSEVADQPAPMAIPELANLPTPTDPAAATTGTTNSTNTADATPPSNVSLPPAPPTINESADMVAGDNNTGATVIGAPALNVAGPKLSLPGLSNFPEAPGKAANTLPAGTGSTPTMLSEVDVEAPAAPKTRTWETKLAPAIIPPKTNFNYRRQVLPDMIYRTSYDRENQHLPTRVTREDYAQLLVQRVAANDINGTRALLNEGLSVNTLDGYGQSLLSVARRSGAHDTERLLIARGAS